MTPREADIAYALEGVEGVVGVFSVAPPASSSVGAEPAIEIVVQVRPLAGRVQGHVAARLASAFADEARPPIVILDADASSLPHLMTRAAQIVLSRSDREAAMARSELRAMRRRVLGMDVVPERFPITREMRERRSCVLVVDPQSLGIERSILRRIDAEVRVVGRDSPALLDVAIDEVSAGEVDLVLFDARRSTKHIRDFFEPLAHRFGISARFHFYIVVDSQTYGAKELTAKYPHLPVPLDIPRFTAILDNASRWRRAEGRSEGDAPSEE